MKKGYFRIAHLKGDLSNSSICMQQKLPRFLQAQTRHIPVNRGLILFFENAPQIILTISKFQGKLPKREGLIKISGDILRNLIRKPAGLCPGFLFQFIEKIPKNRIFILSRRFNSVLASIQLPYKGQNNIPAELALSRKKTATQ